LLLPRELFEGTKSGVFVVELSIVPCWISVKSFMLRTRPCSIWNFHELGRMAPTSVDIGSIFPSIAEPAEVADTEIVEMSSHKAVHCYWS